MSIQPVDLGEHMPSESTIMFTSLDGLHLVGDLTIPDSATDLGVVQVHGGGVTRHEAGFFDREAACLAEAGVAALRFDLRGHGESGGKQEDLTPAGVLNDIQVALEELRARTGATRTSLVRQSFGGGICAYYAARRPDDVERLVLLCPQLDDKKRTIESRAYWAGGHLSSDKARVLTDQGYIRTQSGSNGSLQRVSTNPVNIAAYGRLHDK